jgi:uncharacterized membrane protein
MDKVEKPSGPESNAQARWGIPLIFYLIIMWQEQFLNIRKIRIWRVNYFNVTLVTANVVINSLMQGKKSAILNKHHMWFLNQMDLKLTKMKADSSFW